MKKALSIISDIVFVIVIVAIITGSFMFAINKDPNKDILGFRVYNVLSASMEPKIGVGDLVVVKVKSGEEVQRGDIVTYYPIGDNVTTVTHRVINTMMKDGQVYIETKGDAVDQADPMITADEVVGVVVFSIPFIGGAMAWIQGHVVISAVIVAVVIVLFIGSGFIKKKKENKENKDINA